MSDVISKNSVNIKQAIIDEGLYEEGMTNDDMEHLYRTLNQSKRTANEENEYRELLSQTDVNCSNIELIKTNTTTLDSDNEVHLSIEEVFTNNSEDTEHKKPKSDDIFTYTKNISFNFDTPSKFKTVEIEKHNKNIVPILYHQPYIRMLPAQKKIDLIKLYLRYEQKKNNFNKNFVDQWGKPIIYVPKQHDYKIESQISEVEENISQPDEPSSETFRTLRSSRLTKRKNYKEFMDSDDDDSKSVQSKKTKMNRDLSKERTPVQKNNNKMSNSDDALLQVKLDSDFEFSPILNKTKSHDSITVTKSTPISKSGEISKKSTWFSKSNISDRTNKILNKVKDKENKNITNNEKSEEENLSDTIDEIFPIGRYNSLEVTPKPKKEKNSIRKKLQQIKTRKKLALKSTIEEETTNTNTEITTTSFYGKSKNKEIEIDASNNNKNCADMMQCPICSQPFSSDEIEYHASRCELYNDIPGEKLCAICNKNVENGESNAHAACLEQITEDSIETSYDKNKNKAKVGFLCNVCDKYVVDSNQFEHASNCIATVDDG